MMNLTKKGLPNVVEINGRPYSIYTDFRLWMRFEIAVSKMRSSDKIEIGYLFKNERPDYCNIVELFSFSRPQNPLPRSTGHGSDAIVLDYEVDADLIYAAFLGQYGIDLMEVEDLHWHKFLALLRGLNESTKLREVMGYRCYEKSHNKNRDVYEELRWAWQIERDYPEDHEEAEKFSNYFE